MKQIEQLMQSHNDNVSQILDAIKAHLREVESVEFSEPIEVLSDEDADFVDPHYKVYGMKRVVEFGKLEEFYFELEDDFISIDYFQEESLLRCLRYMDI
jgi:hypothetical protein